VCWHEKVFRFALNLQHYPSSASFSLLLFGARDESQVLHMLNVWSTTELTGLSILPALCTPAPSWPSCPQVLWPLTSPLAERSKNYLWGSRPGELITRTRYMTMMEYYSVFKIKGIPQLPTTWGPREHYVKWNKPGTERQMPHDLTHMCNWKRSNSQKQNKMLPEAGVGRDWEGVSQRIQNFS
jgi:hypothetical protein